MPTPLHPKRAPVGMPKETMLELVELDDGKLVLRPVNSDEAPLLSIEFSEQVKEMIGGDAQYIGQHMVQAAIHSFMHKQAAQWHAHVYDQEPAHYS